MQTIHINRANTEFNLTKEAIIQQINSPAELEKLYRKNKSLFQRVFSDIFPEIQHYTTAQIWNERLNFTQDEINWGNKKDIIFIFLATIITGLLAKIPEFTNIKEEFFYMRNIGLIGFPMLMVYFLWKQKSGFNQLILPIISIIFSVVYMNSLPDNPTSDSLLLACIHLPIFLWSILAYSFVGGDLKNQQKRIDYLRYNGDFVVMASIMVLSGVLFTAITINLFTLIGFNIELFYAKHIAIWGVSAIPFLATYLVQNNPQLVNKISPVIAKIFTPLVFITLLAFLSALVYSRKDIYNDRNFLLIFNALLIGVMAIILFSVTEATKNSSAKLNILFLFFLSVLTIISNGIALSAIAFRLSEFGITPNRIAVLGGNLLIFINLILVARKLYLTLNGKSYVQNVGNIIGLFIPVYGIWAAIVTYLFPILFNYK